jgi:copper chaperone CopZ
VISILRVAPLAAATLFFVACNSVPSNSDNESGALSPTIGDGTLAPGRYDLVVHGMSCPKCISNLDLQLTRINGVRDPRVDMKNGVVAITVEIGASPSRRAIANAVQDAGFTLAEIREIQR